MLHFRVRLLRQRRGAWDEAAPAVSEGRWGRVLSSQTSNVTVVDHVIEADSIPAGLFGRIEQILAAVNDREVASAAAQAVFSLVSRASVTFTVWSEAESAFIVYDNYRDGSYWEWQVGCPVADSSLTSLMARVKKPTERHVPAWVSDPWFLDYPDFYGLPLVFEDGMLVRAMTVGVKGGQTVPKDRLIYFLQLIGGFCETAFTRLSEVRRAVDAGQTLEREYLLQELHDTAIQDIFACELGLKGAIDQLDREAGAFPRTSAHGGPSAPPSPGAPPLSADSLRDRLAACLSYAQEANSNMRKLMDEDAARRWESRTLVSSLVDAEIAAHSRLSDVPAVSVVHGDAEVGGNLARTVRMFVHECLCNVRKHAHAENAVVFTTVADDVLSLCVEDDGAGFDASCPSEGPADGAPHFGLDNVREAVRLVGGDVSVESAPGEGCRVCARIKLGGL